MCGPGYFSTYNQSGECTACALGWYSNTSGTNNTCNRCSAGQFAPGFRPVDYRWGAIKLRKEGRNARQRAENHRSQLKIGKFTKGILLSELDLSKVPSSAGVYGIALAGGEFLFAAETHGLATRLRSHFESDEARQRWLREHQDLNVFYHDLETVSDYRLARQSLLLKWHQPKWNMVAKLAV